MCRFFLFRPRLLIKLPELRKKKHRWHGFIILKVFMCRGEKPHQKFSTASMWCGTRVLLPRLVCGGIIDKFGCFLWCEYHISTSIQTSLVYEAFNFGGLLFQDFCVDVAFSSASIPIVGWCPEPLGATCKPKDREILAFVVFYWTILGRNRYLGKWWGTPRSPRLVGVLGSFWDDAFERCAGRTLRTIQEGVKSMGRDRFSTGNVILDNVVVLGRCWWWSISTKWKNVTSET